MAFDLEEWLASAPTSPPVVQAGAAVLRRRADPVPSSMFGSRALAALVDRMVETMRAAPGVGLAAPQIGVPLRLFVAEDTEDRMARLLSEDRARRGRAPLPLLVVANPRLGHLSAAGASFYEGCLSIAGYGAIVTRARALTLEGFDAGGAPVAARLEGWPARIVQHETDHLDGALYVDRMISRTFACHEQLGRLSSLPVDDVLREVGEAPRDEAAGS